MGSYAAKFLKQRGGDIRLVNAIEKDRKCWFVIRVDPVKFMEYRQAIGVSGVNISDYGQILACGWGEPEAAVLQGSFG